MFDECEKVIYSHTFLCAVLTCISSTLSLHIALEKQIILALLLQLSLMSDLISRYFLQNVTATERHDVCLFKSPVIIFFVTGANVVVLF